MTGQESFPLPGPARLPNRQRLRDHGTTFTSAFTLRDANFSEYYSRQRAVSPIRTVRTRRWKLNWYDNGDKELYDLRADPHELRNLSGDAAAKQEQAELEALLQAWRPSRKELEKNSTEYSRPHSDIIDI